MSNFVVSKQISIEAESAQVWDALTNPVKTEQYFFNCKVLSGWHQGDPITFKRRMFLIIPIEMNGTIQQIEPGRLLKYTLKNGKATDESAGFSKVTDVLTYENGETVLSITDDVGDGEDAEKRFEKSQKGWDKVLSGLKEFVEKGA